MSLLDRIRGNDRRKPACEWWPKQRDVTDAFLREPFMPRPREGRAAHVVAQHDETLFQTVEVDGELVFLEIDLRTQTVSELE